MSFSDFHGNAETVRGLRDMLARERFPHAMVLSGARGSGKYTLALMLAQPSMIKRPLLDAGGKLLVGFDPGDYAAALL